MSPATALRGPGAVRTLVWIEGALATLLFVVVGVVLAQVRDPQVLARPNARQAVHGLYAVSGILAAPAVGLWLATIGLWLRRPWGRWLAVFIHAGIVAIFVSGPLFGREPAEAGDMMVAAVFCITLVLLLMLRFDGRGARRSAKAAAEARTEA